MVLSEALNSPINLELPMALMFYKGTPLDTNASIDWG